MPPSSVSTTICSSSRIVGAEEDDRAVHQPQLVRVAGLDQPVADPEALADGFRAVGVEARLEALVQRVDPDRPAVHRRQRLHLADRVDAEALRRLARRPPRPRSRAPARATGRSMKKKSRSWSGAGLEVGRAALVDLVGGGGDHRARRLAEDLGEPDDGGGLRGDQVLERFARPDRRQLVGVADEDDVGRLGEAFEQHLGEAQVQHRGLVDDHQLDRQRPAGAEAGVAAGDPFEHPVDRLRLVPGRFLEAAGGAAGRRAEGDLQVRVFGGLDDLLGRPGLADAGAAGEDRDPRLEGAAHRRPLLRRQAALRRSLSPGSWSRWGGAARRRASVAATARSLSSVPSR